MSVLMIRAKVKADAVGDIEAAVGKMFAAIEEAQPAGVRYASCRLPDGVTYVALLELQGEDNPLGAIPAFREFQAQLQSWLAEPPVAEQLTVVGSYRSF